MFLIKPDQTADFEELMGEVKEALGKSENPVRKQQLAGWKVFKAAEPSGATLFICAVIDPAVPAAGTTPLAILAESLATTAGTPENQELLKKYAGRVRRAQSAEPDAGREYAGPFARSVPAGPGRRQPSRRPAEASISSALERPRAELLAPSLELQVHARIEPLRFRVRASPFSVCTR